MSEASCAPRRRSDGFTLIEVIGALVIFSVGVLMVIKLSAALGAEMQYAATVSKLVVDAREQLDSLAAEPFDSLTVASTSDTVRVDGLLYTRTISITLRTAILKEIQVTLTPPGSGTHPRYSATSYMADDW